MIIEIHSTANMLAGSPQTTTVTVYNNPNDKVDAGAAMSRRGSDIWGDDSDNGSDDGWD